MITLVIKSTTATSCHKGQWLRSTTGPLNDRFSGTRKQQCRSYLLRGTFSITLENHSAETNITCLSSSWVILNKEKDESVGPVGRAEKFRPHLLTTTNKHVWGTWRPELKSTTTAKPESNSFSWPPLGLFLGQRWQEDNIRWHLPPLFQNSVNKYLPRAILCFITRWNIVCSSNCLSPTYPLTHPSFYLCICPFTPIHLCSCHWSL